MDYGAVQQAFLVGHEGEHRSLAYETPARRMRDALEPIAAVSFWSRPSYDAYTARGLDFLSGYVWGRASVLGDPHPAVVAAAFGVFEPGLVTSLYEVGRATGPAAEMCALVAGGVAEAMHAALGEPTAEVAAIVAQLRGAAAAVPTTGRPLAAGWSVQPQAYDPWVALWQVTSTLRELRGDGHLAALTAAGIDGLEANVLTELWVGYDEFEYTGTRGWSTDAMQHATRRLHARGLVTGGVLTDTGQDLRRDLEAATDRSMQRATDAIDDLGALVGRLEGWAGAIADRGWVPADPRKRDAG